MPDPPTGLAIPKGLLHIAGDYHISSAFATMLYDTGETEFEEDHLSIAKSEGGTWVNLSGEVETGLVRSTIPFATPGIFEIAKKEPDYLHVNLYPNPATDLLRVELTQNIRYVAVISIFTINGSLLVERTLAPGDNTNGQHKIFKTVVIL